MDLLEVRFFGLSASGVLLCCFMASSASYEIMRTMSRLPAALASRYSDCRCEAFARSFSLDLSCGVILMPRVLVNLTCLSRIFEP